MGNKPGRNDPCPCNSGLKWKKCHGDERLKQISVDATQTIMTLHIVERCDEAGIADPDTVSTGIKALADKLARLMPKCIKVNQVVVEPPVPEIDKLEEKAKEDDSLDRVQEDMVACVTCGMRLPFDMKCVKCERKKNA